MIFPLCKWYFDINWHKFEKRWADVFQIYPNAIHLNPLQFCPSMPLLGFPVFCLSSSRVLNRYFHILVNSMTIWSVLKLPKIAWPRIAWPRIAWPRIAWPSPLNDWPRGKQWVLFPLDLNVFWGEAEGRKQNSLFPAGQLLRAYCSDWVWLSQRLDQSKTESLTYSITKCSYLTANLPVLPTASLLDDLNHIHSW